MDIEKEYDKEYHITRDLILEMLTKAIGDYESFLKIKKFIFNYNYGLGHFCFASENEENFFIFFSDYLVTEETYGDINRDKNLLWLKDLLVKNREWSKGLLTVYICYDVFNKYYKSLIQGKISYGYFDALIFKYAQRLFLNKDKIIDFFFQEKSIDKKYSRKIF